MPEYLNPGAYVEETPSGAQPIAGASTSRTAFIGAAQSGPEQSPTAIHSFAEFEAQFGGLWSQSELGFTVRDFFHQGGRDAIIVRLPGDGASLTATDVIGDADAALGLHALDTTDFNILCLPPLSADQAPAAAQAAATYCQGRRAIALLGPPDGWTIDDAEQAATNLGVASSYAAFYFPRLRTMNPLTPGEHRLTSPTGAVAGLCARTDRHRGVWKAPAGLAEGLHDVDDLEFAVNSLQNGAMNQNGVNVIRAFEGRGVVVWGARTLGGADPQYNYVPVRRFANFIEESVHTGLQWTVFEPNGPKLWASLRLNVGAFMHQLFRRGAFQSVTPDGAYFVKCDEETTTAADFALGVVNLWIGFAPVRTAEFLVVRFKLKTADLNA